MSTSLKPRLLAGDLTIGSWLSWGFPPVAELMAKAGFDWLVVDQEHTAIGVAEMHQLVQVISLAGLMPLVRVPANDPVWIKHALDAGAEGVLVPQINSAEEAARAVSYAYYPPKGNRGAGLARAQAYGIDFGGYCQRAAHDTVVIVQIEHIRAVEALDRILAVDGVDGFIIGPYDLSASLGYPGEWDHPDVRAALDEVARHVRLGRKLPGYHVVHSNHRELSERIDAGYRFIAWGDDMVFMAEKVRDEVAAARRIAGR